MAKTYRVFATYYRPPIYWTLAAGLCVYAFFKFVIEPKWIGFLLTASLVSGFWIALKHVPNRWGARLVVSAALITFGLSDEFTQDAEDLAANGVIDADDPAAGEPKPKCPKCAGTMWDNREGKRNPKAPDYKCKDKKCEGAYWPGEWPPKTEDAAAEPTVSEEGAPDPITPATPWPSGENEGVPINLLPDKFLRWATADGRKLGDRTLEWQAACSDVLDSRAETRRKKLELTDEIPF